MALSPGLRTGMERVLIVGGSSGMGLALARRLLGEAGEIIIAGRSRTRLDAAWTALGSPPNVRAEMLDATREQDVAEFFRTSGPIDHIVTTAASIDEAYRLLPELSLSAVRRVTDSKLFGPWLLAKYGAPMLREKGSLTFTSGIAAYRPAAKGSAVAAVNGALESLASALAIELAPIRVNVVSPGWVDTPIWDQIAGDAKAETLAAMAKRLPVGRIGQVEDIADAIRFVMGNGFVTGTVLHVDGGHRLV